MKLSVFLLGCALVAIGRPALADQWGLTPPGGIDSATFGPMTVKFTGCDKYEVQVPMKTAKGGAFYYRFLRKDGSRSQYLHFSDNGPAIVYAIDSFALNKTPAIVIVEETLEVHGTIYPHKNVAPFPPSGDPATWKPVAHHKTTHACSPVPAAVQQQR